jgi:hypothetical protein
VARRWRAAVKPSVDQRREEWAPSYHNIDAVIGKRFNGGGERYSSFAPKRST